MNGVSSEEMVGSLGHPRLATTPPPLSSSEGVAFSSVYWTCILGNREKYD